MDEWVKVIPSLSCDIPRMARQGIEAEVDNSNGLSESGFKYWKNNEQRKTCESDPGLFLMHWYQQDQASNELFVDDLENLPVRVEEANARKQRRYEPHLSQNDQTDDR